MMPIDILIRDLDRALSGDELCRLGVSIDELNLQRGEMEWGVSEGDT